MQTWFVFHNERVFGTKPETQFGFSIEKHIWHQVHNLVCFWRNMKKRTKDRAGDVVPTRNERERLLNFLSHKFCKLGVLIIKAILTWFCTRCVVELVCAAPQRPPVISSRATVERRPSLLASFQCVTQCLTTSGC